MAALLLITAVAIMLPGVSAQDLGVPALLAGFLAMTPFRNGGEEAGRQ